MNNCLKDIIELLKKGINQCEIGLLCFKSLLENLTGTFSLTFSQQRKKQLLNALKKEIKDILTNFFQMFSNFYQAFRKQRDEKNSAGCKEYSYLILLLLDTIKIFISSDWIETK
jgi:hypothetical protein